MDKRNRYLVPLDLVMDYPVNWEFWRILRDLIQNFYDSIGYENFHKEFDTIILLIKQVTSRLP